MQRLEKGNRMIFHLIYHILVLLIEILLVLLVVFVVIRCCQGSYSFCYEVFGSVSVEEPPGQEKVFEVTESDTMFRVAKRLYHEDLIAGRFSFYVRTKLMDQNQIRLRPGSYVLNTGMDYEEIINKLTMSE